MRSILCAILLMILPVCGEPLDLSTEATWELHLRGCERYQVGQRMVIDFYSFGDPFVTGSRDPMAGNNTYYPRSAAQDEQPRSFLNYTGSSTQDVWSGQRRGHLVWIRTTRLGSELWREDEVIGQLGGSLTSWEEQLGAAYCRLRNSKHTIRLYRATMADIGLQLENEKVDAVILMEPGQLRTHLLRRGDYQEL